MRRNVLTHFCARAVVRKAQVVLFLKILKLTVAKLRKHHLRRNADACGLSGSIFFYLMQRSIWKRMRHLDVQLCATRMHLVVLHRDSIFKTSLGVNGRLSDRLRRFFQVPFKITQLTAVPTRYSLWWLHTDLIRHTAQSFLNFPGRKKGCFRKIFECFPVFVFFVKRLIAGLQSKALSASLCACCW